MKGVWLLLYEVIAWSSVVANVTLVVLNARMRGRLKQVLHDFKTGGPSPEALQAMHRRLMSLVGYDQDLVQRAVVDLGFLHTLAYGAAKDADHCPVCHSTLPELQQVLEVLRSIEAMKPPGTPNTARGGA